MKEYKIFHIITGLKVGGAENALLRLILHSPDNYKHIVLCLTTGGAMHDVFLKSKINVITLDFKKSFFKSFYCLIKHIRRHKPDIVQTWLYHANLLGGVSAKLSGVNTVIWGLRGTAIPQSSLSLHNLVMSFGSFMSYFVPSSIVCNAESVRNFHANKGYSKNKLTIIPNGFYFQPKDLNQDQKNMKSLYGLNNQSITIGTIGRYDRLKDYPNMANACALIMKEFKNVHLIMIGRGLDSSNIELVSLLSNKLDLSRVHLLGERSDISNCLKAIDIFCLSSRNEGFPNVVCEAMLMSIPCVVTDAGDAANIVSHAGITVPTEDHIKLASGLKYMIEIGAPGRKKLGDLSFSQIKSNYSIEKNISCFNKLYMGLINAQ